MLYFTKLTVYRAAQEAETGVVELKEVDPTAVKLMIDFLYLLDYKYPEAPPKKSADASPAEVAKSQSQMVMHARVFALADMYDIPDLKDFALERFKGVVEDWQQAMKKKEFFAAVAEVCTDPSLGHCIVLRRAVVNALAKSRDAVLNNPEAQAVIMCVPDLAFDVLLRLMRIQKRSKGL